MAFYFKTKSVIDKLNQFQALLMLVVMLTCAALSRKTYRAIAYMVA